MVCLDSWAVMAWLKGEQPAAEAVETAIATGRPAISWMNVAEVFYLLARKAGKQRAADTVNEMRFLFDCEIPTERRVLESAIVKAENSIAFADCFAISLAKDYGGVLYTGDREILELKDLPCEVRDLRR
ncbi:MAG: type II toxin-antitoxin system VapC family toxin [Solirubrobacterales bacterium]